MQINPDYNWIWMELNSVGLPGDVYGDDSVVWGSSLGPYYNSTENINKLKSVASNFPDLAHYFEFGKSYLGKPLAGVRLTTPTTNDIHKKYETLVIGAHHAREAITVIDALLFIDLLLYDYLMEATWAVNLLNNAEVYVVPMLNPDGLDHLYVNPWQRKNLEPYDGDNDGNTTDDLEVMDVNNDGYVGGDGSVPVEGVDLDGDGKIGEDLPGGVDLNRNYGYKFGLNNQGSSQILNWETYRGPYAFSAPETRAFSEWAKSHHFFTSLSLHSGVQSIIYPWGFTDIPAPDNDAFSLVANEMQELSYFKLWDLYYVNGEWGDWMYGELDSFAMTIETYGNSSSFFRTKDGRWGGIWDMFNPPANQILDVSFNGVQKHIPYFLSVPQLEVIPSEYNITNILINNYNNDISVIWEAEISQNSIFASIEQYNSSSASWNILHKIDNVNNSGSINVSMEPSKGELRFYMGTLSQGWSYQFDPNSPIINHNENSQTTTFPTSTVSATSNSSVTNNSTISSANSRATKVSSSTSSIDIMTLNSLLVPLLIYYIYRKSVKKN